MLGRGRYVPTQKLENPLNFSTMHAAVFRVPSHFANNNLSLYLLGPRVVAELGSVGFLQLYVVGGLFSSLW